MGFLGLVVEAPSSLGAPWLLDPDSDSITSSAPRCFSSVSSVLY